MDMNAIAREAVVIETPARLNPPEIARMRRALEAPPPGSVVALRARDPELFCAGLDFGAALALRPDDMRAGLEDFAALLSDLRTAPFSTIAVVSGAAFGGGVGIAAACDFVLAEASARFGLPEVIYGFYPAIVFAVLDERLSRQNIRLLALQAESVDAFRAFQLGLVDRVAETTNDMELLLRRQTQRLRRAQPAAVAALKSHAPHVAALLNSLAAGVDDTAAQLQRSVVRKSLKEAAS